MRAAVIETRENSDRMREQCPDRAEISSACCYCDNFRVTIRTSFDEYKRETPGILYEIKMLIRKHEIAAHGDAA